MKFKELTPGMIIHCPEKENAKALILHFAELGYTWENGISFTITKDSTLYEYYRIMKNKKIRWLVSVENEPGEITEFSDMIELEDKNPEWITTSDTSDTFTCPICGHHFDFWKHEQKDFRYCPHCGTGMRKPEGGGKEREEKSIETYTVDCCKIFRNEDNKQLMCWLEESDKHGDPWEWADEKYKWFCSVHRGTPEDFYYAEVSRRIYRKGGTA